MNTEEKNTKRLMTDKRDLQLESSYGMRREREREEKEAKISIKRIPLRD